MRRLLLALAGGFFVNIAGYIVSISILSVVTNKYTGTPPLWFISVVIWLLSMLLGGYVVAAMLRKRSFYMGWLSGFIGVFALAIFLKGYLQIDLPAIPALVGCMAVSLLSGVGSISYGFKGKQ